MNKTFSYIAYGVYFCEDNAPTLKTTGGDSGVGGSEILIVEQHLSEIRVYQDVFPTLNTNGGGGHLPMIVDVLPFDTTQITCDTDNN